MHPTTPAVRFIRGILALFPALVQRPLVFALIALLLALTLGCGSPRDAFVRERVVDACTEAWPVCGGIVGCLLGGRSYTEGRFPGTVRIGVVLHEPSLVRVGLLLENVRSEGTQTVFNFYEDGCRDRVRVPVTGRVFVGEAEREGVVVREAELFGEGEHLIEVESDAQTEFLLRVELLPLRGN